MAPFGFVRIVQRQQPERSEQSERLVYSYQRNVNPPVARREVPVNLDADNVNGLDVRSDDAGVQQIEAEVWFVDHENQRTSPRNPQLSAMMPNRPAPRSSENFVFARLEQESSAPVTSEVIPPSPPTKYGRKLRPVVPPYGVSDYHVAHPRLDAGIEKVRIDTKQVSLVGVEEIVARESEVGFHTDDTSTIHTIDTPRIVHPPQARQRHRRRWV